LIQENNVDRFEKKNRGNRNKKTRTDRIITIRITKTAESEEEQQIDLKDRTS
jgi:hypothetical protein